MVPLAIDLVLRPVLHRINSTVASGSCVKHNEMGIWKMNERIRELAKQAGCSIDGMGYGEGNVEMFAELIVKECMTIAKNWEDQLENANSLGESNAVGIVAYRIARQFGVKE